MAFFALLRFLRKVMLGLDIWTALAACLGLVWLWWKRPGRSFPPGPRGVPFLGVLPFVGRKPERAFQKWSRETFGPVMSVRMGMTEVVTLNTYDVINQAYNKQGDCFSGRPWVNVFCQVLQRDGIGFKDYGEDFKTQKRFVARALKDFGMGGKGMEDIIHEGMRHLMERLNTSTSDPVDLKGILTYSIADIIAKVTVGQRFNYDDTKFTPVVDALTRQSHHPNPFAFMVCFLFPTFRFLPPFRAANQYFKQCELDMLDAVRPMIEEHKRTFDRNNVRDVIDAFLKEKEAREEQGDMTFSNRQLEVVVRDLFHTATETTLVQLMWAFVGVLGNNDYYDSITKEIDDVTDSGCLISMEHRRSMPFTCAYLQEILRFCTIVPLGINHYVTRSTTLCGHNIPKGTEIMSNLWAANNDPDVWKNPDVFDPLRHIDENGKFVHSTKILSFSIGPRVCLGESLARMELFLIFTTFLQKFSMSFSDSNKLPTFSNGESSGFLTPLPFKVILKVR